MGTGIQETIGAEEMADYTYEALKKKYETFEHSVAVVMVNGKDISKNKAQLLISEVEVENASGFESSIAHFDIQNCFDMEESKFQFDAIQNYITLGFSLQIYMGYGSTASEVFCGVITKVNFQYDNFSGNPFVRVTAMDIKGIMMSSSYSKQLTKTVYSEAVYELLTSGSAYKRMKSKKIMKDIMISDTPDKQAQNQMTAEEKITSVQTIELVAESDYEFVVRAAKKFNFEFFILNGVVYFRKAKSNKTILMELEPSNFLTNFNIEYDITGLSGKIEVRGMDVARGKAITASRKFENTISNKGDAGQIVKQSTYVSIDPSVQSEADANNRLDTLVEDMSYRFGSIHCECVGMPELIPGRFIKIINLGTAVSNTFYITTVRHYMDQGNGYRTYLTGKTAFLEES